VRLLLIRRAKNNICKTRKNKGKIACQKYREKSCFLVKNHEMCHCSDFGQEKAAQKIILNKIKIMHTYFPYDAIIILVTPPQYII
jgi:hypothetical protein